MNEELMFQMAVQLTAAKLQAHFISPGLASADAWIADQIAENWDLVREVWHRGNRADNVRPIG